MCKSIVDTAGRTTDDNIKRRMHIACWIPKATSTHSQYVVLIAFPLQQWLNQRASVLRYTYVACLVLPCSQQPPIRTFSALDILILSSHLHIVL